jgi:hypothetical protein
LEIQPTGNQTCEESHAFICKKEGFVSEQGKTVYRVSTHTQLSHEESKKYCVKWGGSLAQAFGKLEKKFVSELLGKSGKYWIDPITSSGGKNSLFKSGCWTFQHERAALERYTSFISWLDDLGACEVE